MCIVPCKRNYVVRVWLLDTLGRHIATKNRETLGLSHSFGQEAANYIPGRGLGMEVLLALQVRVYLHHKVDLKSCFPIVSAVSVLDGFPLPDILLVCSI